MIVFKKQKCILKKNIFDLKKLFFIKYSTTKNEIETEEIFEPIDIFPEKEGDIIKIFDKKRKYAKLENKKIMEIPTNLDWPSVWPSAQTFDPNRVPLPIYQGAPSAQKKFLTRMERWQNSELIKIPNFLHLTPKAIDRQTNALKKFCTKWPEKITEECIEKNFPIVVKTTDRVHASPSIRDPEARVVTLKLSIDSLKLDEHAKDKLIKLLRHRYDPMTKMIKIETKDCPFKEQNLNLGIYRLTAAFFESWKIEDWEIEKQD